MCVEIQHELIVFHNKHMYKLWIQTIEFLKQRCSSWWQFSHFTHLA